MKHSLPDEHASQAQARGLAILCKGISVRILRYGVRSTADYSRHVVSSRSEVMQSTTRCGFGHALVQAPFVL